MATEGQTVVERVTELGSKRALLERFAQHRSAQLLLVSAAAVALVRVVLATSAPVSVGPLGFADLVVIAIGIGLIGVVEWFAHRVLFHAPEDSRRSRLLNTGASHRRHHADPTDMAWVLLHPRGARALMIAVAVLVVVWSVPVAIIIGAPPLGPYLSAVAVGWFAIANYEWTHLLAHSSYRPRTPYYRRLVRNHRIHHFRDPESLYGISSNLGDRLFATLRSD
ncbi:MAG: sterol desaturase family protein [Acidimicrobiales bacterium]